MKNILLSVAFVVISLVVICFAASADDNDAGTAPSASMNEQILHIPLYTDPPVSLLVTVLTPDGPGPFPLVILNHGASGKKDLSQEPRYHNTLAAYYFLSRGYAVVLPMMRGFAGSEGHQVMKSGCYQEELGTTNAQDILTVATYMLVRPYVDGRQFVVSGQSMGGWNTLAFGSLGHPKLKGIIDFAGGVNISSCASSQPPLALGAKHFGAKTSVPSLWFYGDNDSQFAPPVWRSMYQQYTAAGGKADLVAYGRFMDDSHNMLGFQEGMRIWVPKVDAFLASIGMPNQITHPEYLPTAFPEPSGFAAISDVDAVPYINDAGRDAYRKFLTYPLPRVFVIANNGNASDHNGGFDPAGKAMKSCMQHAQKCQIYAVDNDVTWVRPTPAPATSDFAKLDDAAAIPYINEAGRQGYRKYLTMRKPKAFVIAADGAWTAAALGDDPLNVAMQTCTKKHQDCRYYAVDDHVVWPAK